VGPSTVDCNGTLGGTVAINKLSDFDFTVASGCSITLGAAPTTQVIGYWAGVGTGASFINNGTIVVPSGAWTHNGDVTDTNMGTFTNNGTITHNGTTWLINDMHFVNSPGATVTMAGTAMAVEWNFTQNGTFDLAGKTLTLGGNGAEDTVLSGTGTLGTVQLVKTTGGAEMTLGSNVTIAGNFHRIWGAITNPASAYTLEVQGDLVANRTDQFGGSNLTVKLGGGNVQNVIAPQPTIAGPFRVEKTIGTTATLSGPLTLGSTLDIVSGTLDQGSGASLVTGGTLTVGANGRLQNLGAGALTLGGDVSNAGVIRLDGGGDGCGHDTDDILVRSSTGGVQRAWNGSGVFNIADTNVQDQGGTAPIMAYSSTPGTNNGSNWSFDGGCAGQRGPGSGSIPNIF
jgi:hypothetical protein